MKSNRQLADIAAKVLAAEATDTPAVTPAVRLEAIAAIARAMRGRERRRRLRWTAVGAATIAASLALAIGLSRGRPSDPVATVVPQARPVPPAAASFVRGSPVVVRNGTRTPLLDGTSIDPGDRLIVEPGSRTTVALANGTYLLVEERSELTLTSPLPATSFDLEAGAVRADVAKLAANERFIIRTVDAEVEVRGTSFDVATVASDPACGNGSTTRVVVREGIVAVRANGSETLVHANEVWPRGCVDSTLPAPPPSTAFEPTPSLPGSGTPAVTSKAPAVAPGSNLAAQNDLFERAIARKRSGDVRGAILGFEDLLVRHPTSHLAQSARAERMKLLRGVDRQRARAAAQDYLAKHPNGFARADAELILASD